jgi:4'-phosphopantetheinyl transferase
MKSPQNALFRTPGGRPVPGPGEVHIWRVEVPAEDARGAARRALATLLADYLGGGEMRAGEPGRVATEAADAAGGAAASEAADIATEADPNGKPRLARDPGRLTFNLSHSGSLALVAIAPGGTEVGVDVERLRPRRDLVRLAARWLPAPDAAAVSAADDADREATFYAAWTRHEARVKCTGAGLAGPPPGPEIVAVQLAIDDGYAAAVATEGTARIVLRDACDRA